MRAFLLPLAALSLAACDSSYTLHLSTKVTAQGAPAAGAWVIPLSRRSSHGGSAVGVRTGADGTAVLSQTEFLRHPADNPVAVRADNRPTCVVRPASEVALKGRGLFFVTEFDADLAVDLGGAKCAAARRIALRCGDDAKCEITLDEPAETFCDGFVVSVDANRAMATLVGETLASNGMTATPRKWAFARPVGSAAFLAVCTDRKGGVSISIAE